MRKIVCCGAILIVLAGPALAQSIPTGPSGPSREQIEKERREESAARRAMERVPDKQPASKDPWGKVRAAPDGPAAAKKSRP